MTAVRQCNSLIAVFEEQVKDHPEEIALIVEDGRASWTYRELDNLAAELSVHIATKIDSLQIDMGGNDTPLVSVMMNREGAGIVAAILATLKAGAAYVPVDPSFPSDRQSYIFKHSRCHLAVVDEECLEKAKELGIDLPPTVVVISRTAVVSKQQPPLAAGAVQQQLQQESITDKRAEARKRVNGGLAYVLYTSGSTGNPKGVMVAHEGVVNIISWFGNELVVGPGKKILGLTTFCFDISVLEMFMPLLHGATLVLAFSSTLRDPFRLLDIVEEQRIDVVQATPTTFEMMLATGWRGDPLLDVLVGGETFRPSLLPMVANSRSVRNVYGPTEATVWSSAYTLPRDILKTTHAASPPPSIPIGAPISKTQFYIATETDANRLAGAYEEGELCIGGVGVARGYLHADDLTTERFVSTPYDSCGGKVYRTGDVVKQDAEGNYVFIRRMDDQVKVDGFRIELAEIESVFLLDERVEQAVALVRNGRRLAIYLQPSSGHTLDSAALDQVFAAAARKLTHYMIPKDRVVVSSFPQTANGKVDKKALTMTVASD